MISWTLTGRYKRKPEVARLYTVTINGLLLWSVHLLSKVTDNNFDL